VKGYKDICYEIFWYSKVQDQDQTWSKLSLSPHNCWTWNDEKEKGLKQERK
jgi:hypothetical protein